jgi:diacylglycerol kinase family enzyme
MDAGGGLLNTSDAPEPSPPRLRTIELLANPLAGRVGAEAPAEAAAIVGEFGLSVNVRAPGPTELEAELKRAVDAAPDLLIVLAGDGTAGAAARLCGPDGPLVAPLAGGTMNMLPHALYGDKDWRVALRETLQTGVERPVSGGELDGVQFYVAAILGPPAMWAEAREAARVRRLDLALRKARIAWGRAFQNSLRFALDGGGPVKAEALTLMCPLVSRAMAADEPALEAAVLRPKSPAEAARLGLHALLSEVIGDWRKDPAVEVTRCRSGWALAPSARIHAILDGEPIRLAKLAHFRFLPVAFRALAPPFEEPEPAIAPSVLHG